MPYLLMLGYLLTRTFSAVTTKSNSRSYSALGAIGSFLYIFVTAVYSLFFFWALNGFVLTINTTVIIYGALYAGIVIMNLVPTVFMYNYGSITSVSFISNTISLIASAIAGVLVFSEVFTLDKLVRIAIMLLCVYHFYRIEKKASRGRARRKKKTSPTRYRPACSRCTRHCCRYLVYKNLRQ